MYYGWILLTEYGYNLPNGAGPDERVQCGGQAASGQDGLSQPGRKVHIHKRIVPT